MRRTSRWRGKGLHGRAPIEASCEAEPASVKHSLMGDEGVREVGFGEEQIPAIRRPRREPRFHECWGDTSSSKSAIQPFGRLLHLDVALDVGLRTLNLSLSQAVLKLRTPDIARVVEKFF